MSTAGYKIKACIFFVWIMLVARLAIAAPTIAVEVEADKLQINHKLKTASFSGHVHVSYGAIRLSCDEMIATYDDFGKVISLRANGAVRVKRGDAVATAAVAVLDARLNLLVLLGNPVLVQGQNRLEGKRITVHIESGKVNVEQAKGKFTLGGGAKK